jgi:DegV family protein with EDD domain
MNEYAIITDSTSDLSPSMLERYSIQVLPMEVLLGDRIFLHYPDARNMSFGAFYNQLRGAVEAKTTQINLQAYLETFEDILSTGKDVFYIGFSSGLSGSFGNAVKAAEELRPRYPSQKVAVIDSLSASTGEGFLVYHAALEKEKGKSFDELEQWVLQNRLRVNHWFVVDDLFHLKRGGRVSSTAAVAGSMLGIKPLLKFDDQGKMAVADKIRSRKKSLKELVVRMEQNYQPCEDGSVFVSHGDCMEDAQFVEALIREKFAVSDVLLNYIGPVIGAHSGPNTVALFYFGDTR